MDDRLLNKLSYRIVSFRYQLTPSVVIDAKEEFLRELAAVEKSFINRGKELFSGLGRADGQDAYRDFFSDSVNKDAYNKMTKSLYSVLSRMTNTYRKYIFEVLLHRYDNFSLFRLDKKQQFLLKKIKSAVNAFFISHTFYYSYWGGNNFNRHTRLYFSDIRSTFLGIFNNVIKFAESTASENAVFDLAEVVNWRRFSFIPDGGLGEVRMHRTIKEFQEAVRLIEQSGYGGVVSERMDVVVTNLMDVDGTAAAYLYGADKMILYPSGCNAATIIHEFGHRLYFRLLSPGDRSLWERVHNGDVFVITRIDVDKVLSFCDEYTDEDSPSIKNAIERYRRQYRGDPLVDKKAEVFLRSGFPDGGTPPCRGYLEQYWHKKLVGKRLLKNHISDYGDTNEHESFAELFEHIVLGRGAVPEELLYWFNRVTGRR